MHTEAAEDSRAFVCKLICPYRDPWSAGSSTATPGCEGEATQAGVPVPQKINNPKSQILVFLANILRRVCVRPPLGVAFARASRDPTKQVWLRVRCALLRAGSGCKSRLALRFLQIFLRAAGPFVRFCLQVANPLQLRISFYCNYPYD